MGPIALLRSKQVDVFVKAAKTHTPFTFAYTDPKKDVDVSSHMFQHGLVESGITRVRACMHAWVNGVWCVRAWVNG